MAEFSTLPEAFQSRVAANPDAAALSSFDGSHSYTWAEYNAEVRRMAGGLAKLGLGRGDVFACLLTNRTEFNLVEMAANHLGATTFSIYNTSSVDQVKYLLEHSGASILVTERQYVAKVHESGVAVGHILVVEDGDLDTLSPADDFDFEAVWKAVQPDDVLCMIYTSGTTGPPKGVEHTHRGVLGMGNALTSVFEMRDGDRVISYLPAAHAADRCITYYFGVINGVHLITLNDMAQLLPTLLKVRPTIFSAVPRVWEKLKAGVEAKLAANDDLRAAFDADVPEVIEAIRVQLGLEQVRWAMSGAASCPPAVFAFMRKLKVPVTDIWGMSEVGMVTAAPPELARVGTIGTLLPGYEARVLADGELLIRAPFTMKGYRNDPRQTAEAKDADGWVHTGDVVTVDEDGYYTIVDRKKELIINAGGKNMSPTNIENAIVPQSPLIGTVYVVGDRRPYNVALITLEPTAAQEFAVDRGLTGELADLAQVDSVRDAVQAAVDVGNGKLSRVEQIKKFAILPVSWTEGGDELTPTGKLRRKSIYAKYVDTIDKLYA
ncbi:MAG: AMP-binding protein [Gordonia sp. (in: high G+C Gram-positive bacteria)]|uniref:AMP-binding protein n=1 Tax=Gordonia sp. (in: high G+C Gram-positive bacteria) TaxID=84139 RepID=UPI003C72AF14